MCLPSKHSFIRVLDEPWWSLCTNVEWQACLVQGELPRQAGNDAKFARAPKALLMEEFWVPPDPCRTGSCATGYATSDVFFWEVCFFNHVCRNKEALFSVDVGDTFSCDFDQQVCVCGLPRIYRTV
jgi:hypothetical protein